MNDHRKTKAQLLEELNTLRQRLAEREDRSALPVLDRTPLANEPRSYTQLAERLDLATRSARIGIWDWDIQKNELVWDDQMYALYGLKPGEFSGAYEAWLQGVHPDDREPSNAVSQRARDGEGEYDTEFRVVWPDGSVHWLKANGQSFRDEQGTPLRMVGVNYDITDRKRAEEKLHESEEFLRLAYEAANLGIWKNDLQTGSVEFDERGRIHYGFDTLHTTISEVTNRVHPEDVARLGAEIAAATAPTGNGKFTTEYRVIHSDGSIHWLAVGVRVTFEGEGEQRHSVMGYGTSLDITERKLAEEKLRASEERFRIALKNSPIVVFNQDQDLRYSWIHNPQLGFDEEAVLGKTDAELLPVDAAASLTEIKRRVLETGIAAREVVKTIVGGPVLFYDLTVEPLRDSGGNIIGVTCVSVDITDRKRAEDALRQSQANFSKAFDLNPAALAITRLTDGQFIRINAAHTSLIGYTETELAGRTVEALNMYVDPAAKQVIVEALRDHGTVRDHEIQVRTKAGTVLNLLVYMEPMRFDGEECILSTLLDITERKRMEDDLRRSNAELEQFAYVASHDLQEPLRAVAGMVQLLQQRYQGQLGARADEYIHHAVDAANRMQALINDLLTFSRVDRRGKSLEPVNTIDYVHAALKNLEVAIRESEATITCDELPVVTADGSQLTQLFQNLIGNALKFRREPAPQIHISAQRRPDAWEFAVSDNGLGIEPQYFDLIFQVFQRLHTRASYPGTGIGLALCKKIIERHGGRIWVESAFGQGSTFYFTLPIRSQA